jgi:hypothetical protein
VIVRRNDGEVQEGIRSERSEHPVLQRCGSAAKMEEARESEKKERCEVGEEADLSSA